MMVTGSDAEHVPIAIIPPTEEARRLWQKLGELAVEFGPERGWCLIGGLMVQLHAYEHGARSRPTTDIDVLADARQRPSMTRRLAQILRDLGGDLRPPPRTDAKLGYQFDLTGEIVEILGPDGLRDHPRTLGSFETIMVAGGTQALRRTECVSISVDGAEPVTVRRPTLLGAILVKARAAASARGKVGEHRQDLIQLLTFVDDPRTLGDGGALTSTERNWLRAVEPVLAFEDPVLLESFSFDEVERARLAVALLS